LSYRLSKSAGPLGCETLVNPNPSRRVHGRPRINGLHLFLIGVVVALVLGDIAAYHWISQPAPVVRIDGEGYYLYLPAWFVDKDPTLLHTIARHFAGVDPTFAGLDRNARGYTESYGIGVAVLEAPFFLIAQALTPLTGAKADGYSMLDQYAMLVAAAFWAVIGLAFLGNFLRRYFSLGVVLATMAALLLGTDLYHFLTYDASLSHAYSFAAIAGALLALQRWEEQPRSRRRAAFLGVCVGAVVLIRPTNVVLLAFIPLYGVGSIATLRKRAAAVIDRRRGVLVGVLVAVMIALTQTLQWHAESGHWLLRPYPRISFDWLHPHLLTTLFSFDPHGLLPWSPIAALALVGMIQLRRSMPHMFLGVLLSVLVGWYVISAWHFYWYGGGYGNRAFTDMFPLLALPLAAFFASVRRRISRIAVSTVVLILAAVTCAQMIHYWQLRVPFDGMSAADYFRVLFTP
jgi:hypothetical protein